METNNVYTRVIIFSLLILASSASAQMDAPLLEIFIYNYTDGSIEVGDDAQSTIWYNDKKITSQFQSGTFLIPKSDAGGATGNYGFDYAYITYPDDGATDKDTLGYGLYEITVGPVTFHLDLRDANQTGVIDIKIKNDNNGLWWKWYGSCPTGATMGWEEISEGDTLTIWGMFEDCAYWNRRFPQHRPFSAN